MQSALQSAADAAEHAAQAATAEAGSLQQRLLEIHVWGLIDA